MLDQMRPYQNIRSKVFIYSLLVRFGNEFCSSVFKTTTLITVAKNFKRFYFDYEIRKKRGMTKSLIVSVMATKV